MGSHRVGHHRSDLAAAAAAAAADAEEIKKGWKEYMKNCIEKILMNRITMIVLLVTQSQTFWSAKSSGP